MTLDLSYALQDQLHALATRERREISELIEEALSMYVEAAALSDVRPDEVAESQLALVCELPELPAWKGGAD